MAIIHQGRVLLTGDPTALVAQLQNKVWKKSIHASELPAHKEKFQVIQTHLFGGRTQIHVLSDAQPGAGFEPVAPDLEDLYFATIRGFLGQPASTGQVN